MDGYTGSILKMPQYFRLCLTANDDMVNRSLPAFREAAEKFRGTGD